MKVKNIAVGISAKAKSLWSGFAALPKKKKIIIIAVLVIVLAAIIAGLSRGGSEPAFSIVGTEEAVEKRDITSSITGSAVVMPKDQYSITSLVSGDVISADFEQGDVVEEGDILYEIDSDDAKNTIETSDISYQRSQMDYENAVRNYSNLTVKSDISGVIKNLYIKVGDSVNNGTKVADVYDDSRLKLTLTFNDADAANIYIGQSAEVRISSNGELLWGTVTSVNSQGYAAEGNMLVRTVVIEVENPGVLTSGETATATVGEFACSTPGTFEYLYEKTIVAEAAGDIDAVYVTQGSRVEKGTALAHIDSINVSNSMKSAQLSLKSAQLSRDNAQKKLDDYTIKAPISGTVVYKKVKAGDKLDNKNMSTEMAVIYDMSSLECELSVDELDIKNVKIGQSVLITSDAVEGKRYNGEVSNVSVNGTTSGGVTTYPVTIVIKDFDEDLLPGMNIDVTIVTSEATGVLAVPVTAVNRGGVVYVKGDKEDDKDMAPEGFKSVKVETGAYNDRYIEIKSGLSEGDIIYVPQIKSSGTQSGMAAMMSGMHGGMSMGGGMPMGGMGGASPSGMGGMSGARPSGMR